MSTRLEKTKKGLKLVLDVSQLPAPHPRQTYPLPPIPVVQASLLDVSLEPVAQSGRSGIRVVSRGTDLPGGSTAIWTLRHAAYQGAEPASLGWDEIPVSAPKVNLLLDQALPSATHRFALQRREAGQVTLFPENRIQTPADPTLQDIQDLVDQLAAAGDDGYLTDLERPQERDARAALYRSYISLRTQALTYVSVAAMDTAWNAWVGFVDPLLALSGTTPVNRTQWRTLLGNLQDEMAKVATALSNTGIVIGNAGLTTGNNLIPNFDSGLGPIPGVGGNMVLDTGNGGYLGSRYVRSPATGRGGSFHLTDPFAVKVQEGDLFNATAMLKEVAPGTNSYGQLLMWFVDSTGNQVGPEFYGSYPTNWVTGQWSARTDIFHAKAPAGAVSLEIMCHQVGGGVYWFDDIILEKVPSAPAATSTSLGLVKPGLGMSVDATGALTYVGPAGGTAVWGGISGSLANQADLQAALNAKLGTGAQAYDSARLGGVLAASFATQAWVGGSFLGIGAQAYDSARLGGVLATSFATQAWVGGAFLGIGAQAYDSARLGGVAAATYVQTTDPRLSDARTPIAHIHVIGDVSGLQAALNAKADLNGASFTSRVTVTGASGLGGWNPVFAAVAPSYPSVELIATTPNKIARIGNNGDGSFWFMTGGSSGDLGVAALILAANGAATFVAGVTANSGFAVSRDTSGYISIGRYSAAYGLALVDYDSVASGLRVRRSDGSTCLDIAPDKAVFSGEVDASFFHPTGAATSGGMGYSPYAGIALRGQSGSAFDFSIYNPSASTQYMMVMANSNIPIFPSGIMGWAALQVSDGLGGAWMNGAGITIDRAAAYVKTNAAGQSLFIESDSIYFKNQAESVAYAYVNSTAFYFNSSLQGTSGYFTGPLSADSFATTNQRAISLYNGAIKIKVDVGGWAEGTYFTGSAGQIVGGFGLFGEADAPQYHYIGGSYNSPLLKIDQTGNGTFAGGATTSATVSVCSATPNGNPNSDAIEVRETGRLQTAVSGVGNGPRIGFHWGGITWAHLVMDAAATLNWMDPSFSVYLPIRVGDIHAGHIYSGTHTITGTYQWSVGDNVGQTSAPGRFGIVCDSTTATPAIEIYGGDNTVVANGALIAQKYNDFVIHRNGTIDTNTDLSVLANGFYHVGGNPGSPAGVAWGQLFSLSHGDVHAQMYFTYNGSLYWRRNSDGGGGLAAATWRQVFDSGNVDQVAAAVMALAAYAMAPQWVASLPPLPDSKYPQAIWNATTARYEGGFVCIISTRQMYQNQNGVWVQVGVDSAIFGQIVAGMLAAASVGADAIQAAAITAEKIRANTFMTSNFATSTGQTAANIGTNAPTGYPTAGAWFGVGSNSPILVGPKGIQIGRALLDESNFYTNRFTNGIFYKALAPHWENFGDLLFSLAGATANSGCIYISASTIDEMNTTVSIQASGGVRQIVNVPARMDGVHRYLKYVYKHFFEGNDNSPNHYTVTRDYHIFISVTPLSKAAVDAYASQFGGWTGGVQYSYAIGGAETTWTERIWDIESFASAVFSVPGEYLVEFSLSLADTSTSHGFSELTWVAQPFSHAIYIDEIQLVM